MVRFELIFLRQNGSNYLLVSALLTQVGSGWLVCGDIPGREIWIIRHDVRMVPRGDASRPDLGQDRWQGQYLEL